MASDVEHLEAEHEDLVAEVSRRHEEAAAEAAQRSLRDFVVAAWPLVEPAMALLPSLALDAVCEHLEAVAKEQILRLVINIPPGHSKSLLVSVFWPAWMWTRRPGWRALFASYAKDLALRDSVRTRDLLKTGWYQTHFAEPAGWRLKDDEDAKSLFSNTQKGFRMALSVGGAATGFRGDAVVVDDPLNAKDAPSKAAREEAIFWWDKVMSTRLNDQRRGVKLVIMQRLHEDDLTGHILRSELGYEHLCLPSEFEPKRRSVTYVRRPEGAREEFWSDPRQEPGELLFPELFPSEVLAQTKRELGSNGFAGQHQQRPAPDEGGMFKKSWWRFWKPDGLAAEGVYPRPAGCWDGPAVPLPALEMVLISLDANFKGKANSDFVVFTVWGVKGAHRFLLAMRRGRWNFPQTVEVFRSLVLEFPTALKKLVELAANGDAIVSSLEAEIPGLVGVSAKGGKEARAAAISPQVEAGQVFLPEGAAWLEEFVEEFAAFPNGSNDDQVDSTSQALIDLLLNPDAARAAAMSSL
jgi:predicted phage terminase large subunit-like protein